VVSVRLYRNDVREITRISLHEETRQREREEDEARRLAIENRRRVGLGKEPVASFEELEAERDAERLSRADSRDDAEAGEEGPGASSAGDADSTGDSVAAEGSGAADEADEPETSDGTKLVPDAYAKEAAKILVDAIEQPVRKTVRR